MRTDKIYLVGFMGAGKTTTLLELKKRLGWNAVDLDQLIEARAGDSVEKIFSRWGEPYFRSLETSALRGLEHCRHVIIATGGGTFIDEKNRRFMRDDGYVVWLDAPFKTMYARAQEQGGRPLLKTWIETQNKYLERRLLYREAHTRVETSRAVSAIATEILQQLKT